MDAATGKKKVPCSVSLYVLSTIVMKICETEPTMLVGLASKTARLLIPSSPSSLQQRSSQDDLRTLHPNNSTKAVEEAAYSAP